MTSTETAPRRRRPSLGALAGVLALALCAASPAGASVAKGPPFVITGGVSHVRGASVELDGAVDPHGLATTYYFVYGPSESYGYQTPPQALEAKNEHVKVGVSISDFPDGYNYRLVASNSAGNRIGRNRKYGKGLELKFALPKSLPTIVFGHGFTLTGKLVGSGNERVTVSLQETPYPFLEAFADVGATAQTGAGGTFSFRVSSLSESAKFRVVAKQPRPLYSAILTQSVTPRVLLKVQKTSVKGLVRLFGSVAPAEVGARVLLQVNEPARPGNSEKASERSSRFVTQFSTISRHATRTTSRFSVIVKVTRSGEYRAFVELHKGRLASAASGTLHLVAGSSKHHARG